MKDLSDFIDEIVSSHTDADGNLDEFGTLALAFVGISLTNGICKILSTRRSESNTILPFQGDAHE